jgi:hypothetical protein
VRHDRTQRTLGPDLGTGIARGIDHHRIEVDARHVEGVLLTIAQRVTEEEGPCTESSIALRDLDPNLPGMRQGHAAIEHAQAPEGTLRPRQEALADPEPWEGAAVHHQDLQPGACHVDGRGTTGWACTDH